MGRATALTALSAVVDEVCSGAFRVALVTGAAGLGKTRLAHDLLSRQSERVTALTARCYRWGGASSFGPWAEALDRHLRRLPPEEVAALCRGPAARLAPLVGTIARDARPSTTSPDRLQFLEGLVDLLDRLGNRRPVLIAIDDLHLADMSSWEALRYLGRRLDSSPIGIVATARPGELAEAVVAAEVLVGLDEDGLLTRVDLEPLTRTEVTELAHQVLGDEGVDSTFVPAPLVAWLHERSLGHPLFIIGLLRALVAEGADLAAPRLERLPTSLRERVGVDLATLSSEDRQLLEVLAIADQRLDVEQLVALTGWPQQRVEASLDSLLRTRLVSEHAVDAQLGHELSHPIVQESVYEGIGGARRRTLHRSIARRLVASGRLGAAAGHFARAAGPGDDEAVEALCQAMAEAEERGLYQEALAVLDALLDLLPAGDDRWLRVLDAVTWQSEWVLSHLAEGDASTAIAAMERMQAHLAADDLLARGAVAMHWSAFVSFGSGRLDEAEVACQAAIASFEAAGADEEALLARNELAWIRGCAGDLDGQAHLAGAVLEDAVQEGHRRAAIQAASTTAYATGFLGRVADSDDLFATCVGLAEQDGNTYRVAWAHAQRSSVLGLSGRLDEAVEVAGLALGADVGAPDALALENLAQCHWLAGQLERALDTLERSAARRPISGSRRRAWGAALAARVHAERGQPGRAETTLRPATTTYGGEPFLVWGLWLPWTQAVLHRYSDAPAAALEGLRTVAGQLADSGLSAYEALVLTDLAECALEADQPGVAETAALRVAGLANAAEGTLLPSLADLTGALAHLAASDRDAAARTAERALDGLEQGGYAMHAATAREVAAHARTGHDREAAVALLQEAAAELDVCGAVWRRDRVLVSLHRLGSRGRRAAAAVQGPTALTARERQVAELASQGLTAREIGQRLFIGRRTVESHLASCYGKLGISSKRELMRRAAELDLRADVSRP